MRDDADSDVSRNTLAANTLPGQPVGYSILVIEDEVDIAVLIRRILEKALPCTVNLAHDGDAGLAELQRTPYDLVITDMRLPGKHGLELLDNIRDGFPDLSIIVMTGYSDVFPYIEALEAGADDFLTKPFPSAELQAKVLRIVRERDLRRANELAQKKYRSLFESGSEGMALLSGPSLIVTDVNRACCEMMGRPVEAMLGTPFASLLAKKDADRFVQWLELCHHRGKGAIGGIRLVTAADHVLLLDIAVTFIEVGAESIVFINCKDVTERHEIHQQLADAAQRDKLTGLYNKDAFTHRIAGAVDRAVQQQVDFVLLMIDLDNFKRCNDTHGHQVGDRLLAAVGEVIRSSIRVQVADEGFRCGGDEFAVILWGTDRDGGLVVANRMLERFQSIETYGTSMSIGLATHAPGRAPDALVRQADTALYAAKAAGKATICTA